MRGRQEGTAVDSIKCRLDGRLVGSDYIITLTVSMQWPRCDVNFKLPQSQLI